MQYTSQNTNGPQDSQIAYKLGCTKYKNLPASWAHSLHAWLASLVSLSAPRARDSFVAIRARRYMSFKGVFYCDAIKKSIIFYGIFRYLKMY